MSNKMVMRTALMCLTLGVALFRLGAAKAQEANALGPVKDPPGATKHI